MRIARPYWLVDSIERLIGTLLRNRRFRPVGNPIKVNLGSGLIVAPGWVNVDGDLKTLFAGYPSSVTRLAYRLCKNREALSRQEFIDTLRDNVFVYRDLSYGVPLPDRSTDFIFTSHTIHHLYRDEALGLLKDALRTLKPGGIIRVAVPDLAYVVSLYQRGERERALEFFFYPPSSRSQYSRRQYQYDFALLGKLLAEAGYCDIRRCAFQQGRTPDLTILDNRPEETLFVEAQSPR